MYLVASHWESLFSKIHFSCGRTRVGIYTDHDFSQSALLEDMLRYHFGLKIETEIINTSVFSDLVLELDRFDVLITNIPDIVHSGCLVLCWEEFPSREDLSFVLGGVSFAGGFEFCVGGFD